MKEKDFLDDLIEQMKKQEVPVDPLLFQSISASITKTFWFKNWILSNSKWIIFTSSSIAIVTTSIFTYNYFNKKEQKAFLVKNELLKSNEIKSNIVQTKKEEIKYLEIKSLENKEKENPNVEKIQLSKDNFIEDQKVILQENSNYEYISTTEKNKEITSSIPIQENKSLIKQENTNKIVPQNDHQQKNENLTHFPNIFSPNNDGNNDYFEFDWKTKVSDFSITILNSQNQVIYKSSQADFKWDGLMLDNTKVAAGRYLYFFTAKDENGDSISKSSYLQIVY
ncbi:MAG: gliding motility-associated C-terminal domain-containing protein [Flavobacteriia bacterium]|nr:gliding motility-associated C-terminal domain-containing protein [Flavobacteriia bacterium]